MTKNYCDHCEAELTKNEEAGNFIYLERLYPINPDKQSGYMAQLQPHKMDLCEKCCKDVRNYLDKKKAVHKETGKK